MQDINVSVNPGGDCLCSIIAHKSLLQEVVAGEKGKYYLYYKIRRTGAGDQL